MNSPAQRHVTQGLDRRAADDGHFGDLAHLQPVQGSRAALSSPRPVYTESRPGIPIDRNHPFRPIATGLWSGVRPRRMIRTPLQTPRARLPMRKIGDMLRLSAAGLLRLALAQIMHCPTRGI